MKDLEEGLPGDMNPEEFRRYGHELVDWVADYLKETDRYPVLPSCRPGDVRKQLPGSPPEAGEPMDRILTDVRDVIIPGITHWNHPAFFSYFSITGSGPGILGELITAALNVNGMLWRTSPAVTELEELVLDWFRQMLGLPEGFWGIIYDTASVSTFQGLAAARQLIQGLDVRVQGMCECPRRPTFYASEQAHSSVEKAGLALGFGQDGFRKIPVDDRFRMDPTALEAAILADLREGRQPTAVVATVGTTSTTSIDPVRSIGEICRRHGIWLHVDAAYAGSAAVIPEMRWILEGCEQADSMVVNPHKWLFTPVDCSVLFCRRPEVMRQAFSLVPDYLKSNEAATNFMDYGIQLGRRFRALKLWMVIRYFGTRGIAERIQQHIGFGQQVAEWVDADPGFERMAPTPFSTICFRAVPAEVKAAGEVALDDFNQRLLDAVNATGRVFLSSTRLRGKLTLRMAIGNLKTTRKHIQLAWDLLTAKSAELLKEKAGN